MVPQFTPPFRAGQVLEISFPTFKPRITFHSERELTVEAAGAGAAVGIGAQLIQLANEKGAVLQLKGRQIGLMPNLDLRGLAIRLR
jgi:hypothetical protein